MPGMLIATIKDCPVNGGKVKSFDAAKVAGMPGVKKVVQVGDDGVAVIADTYWHAKTALDALPIVWDDGENAKVSSATIAEFLKTGLDADQAFVGNKSGDAKAGDRRRGQEGRGGLQLSLPEPRHHGADERDGALHGRTSARCGRPTQNGEAALAAVVEASGLPASKCDVYKVMLGGGFGRRGRVRLCRARRSLIAKQMPGTPIKLIWSREEDMTHCAYHPITQCKMTGAFDANRQSGRRCMRDFRPVDLGLAGARKSLQNGMDPVTFQGLCAVRRGDVRLQRPEPADRPCDAQPAPAAGLLARRQHQPQRDLRRMLHGRAGQCSRRRTRSSSAAS